jgi:hypothetical protein
MLKRPHPDAANFYMPEDVPHFEDAEFHEKRRRLSLSARRDANKRDRETSEPVFSAADMEHARAEGRLQVLGRFEACLTANDALRKAFGQVCEERDRLANDNRVLKAGVCSLNVKREQLARELEETQLALRDVSLRYQEVERAIALHNMQVGACRRDEPNLFFGGRDGDVC